jgi:hypothetical protein
MLVAQFVVLDFINDSHGHVFVVNPVVDTGLRRSGRIIYKKLILTRPDAYRLSDQYFSSMLLTRLYHAAAREETKNSIVPLLLLPT